MGSDRPGIGHSEGSRKVAIRCSMTVLVVVVVRMNRRHSRGMSDWVRLNQVIARSYRPALELDDDVDDDDDVVAVVVP